MKQKPPRKRTPTHSDDDSAAEVKRILDRISRDSETVATSSMARSGDQSARQSEARKAAEEDPIEVLGRRIGRTLGWIAVAILAVYLVTTYVL